MAYHIIIIHHHGKCFAGPRNYSYEEVLKTSLETELILPVSYLILQKIDRFLVSSLVFFRFRAAD